MDNTQAPAHNVGKPWSLPADFLPVPEGYGPAEPTVVNLKDFNHNQLVQLAVEYNKANGVEDDPFERVLKGIPERAQLRPGSKEPVSHYMGLQGLPPHGKYAKAWKKLIRGSRQLMEDETGPIAKRPKTAAGTEVAEARAKAAAARTDKANHPSQWTWQQLQPVLSAEQKRWRSNLAAYLGRPVDVPLLAPGAPVLDMQELFIRVMQQGGFQRVTESSGWAGLAQHMQREGAFGPLLAAVYDCYLQPLEQDLPFAFRAAKAQDHMSSRVQIRTAMGAKVATYDSVVFTADRAESLLRQLQRNKSPAPPPQQQQQQSLPPAAAADTADGKQQQPEEQQQQPTVDIALCSLQLLQAAAREPGLLVSLLKQRGLHSGLHPPSRQACMQEYRKKLLGASRKRTRSRDSAEAVELLELPDEVLFGADTSDNSGDDSKGQEGLEGSQPWAAAVIAREGEVAARPQVPAAAAAGAAGAEEGEEEGADEGTSTKRGRGRGHGGRRRSRGRGRGGRGRGSSQDPGAAAAADEFEAADEQDAGPAAAAAETAAVEQQRRQLWQSDGVVLDASRWLLLSWRAVLSGPLGCRKPLLQLPGMQERQQDKRVSGSGSSRRGRGKGKPQRVYLGRTPRCGQCRTCLNPGLHRACVVNREKLKAGLKVVSGGGRAGRGGTGSSGRARGKGRGR